MLLYAMFFIMYKVSRKFRRLTGTKTKWFPPIDDQLYCRSSHPNSLKSEWHMASKKKIHRDLPLTRALAEPYRPQANPLEVFKLARKAWLQGRRISIEELSNAVGVSRVTLYRWVGSKDRLIEEILWSFAEPNFRAIIEETPGTGVEHIINVHHTFMVNLAAFDPMRRFVHENPTTAIRIQTPDTTSAHGRFIELAAEHLKAQEEEGYIDLHSPIHELAEHIIFSNGSLLYGAIIGGRDPKIAIEQACAITRMLLEGSLNHNKSKDHHQVEAALN